ncbi:hypothetical protein HZS55_17440 [Halosimplex rubrum]|uniref:Uncharacterized protein n=1 Tax=Halosimplex rubrum TaxID=869889 RepID=A0A7D5T7A6_9EURY|nr:hypothetical protein [Halosimplex rubrum]QLH78969.1 hypothetical protein HZS55_17440 [Halosimplex rubrum]
MSVVADMAEITERHAGESLRYFAEVPPDSREVTVHHRREGLVWTDAREREVEEELHELTAKASYEEAMDATNVNQIVKVADDKVLFTGFIDDTVAVAAFERGILATLPAIVAEFREYMIEEDIEFVALEL